MKAQIAELKKLRNAIHNSLKRKREAIDRAHAEAQRLEAEISAVEGAIEKAARPDKRTVRVHMRRRPISNGIAWSL